MLFSLNKNKNKKPPTSHWKPGKWVGGVNQAYNSAFNHSWSYHRLQVGFGGVCRCMRGDLMWTCLVWAERSTPDNFGVPCHRFNSATGEQKRITETIYTDFQPSSRMSNSFNAKRQADKRKPPILYVFGVTRSGIEPGRPPEPRADALATMLPEGGVKAWDDVPQNTTVFDLGNQSEEYA